MEEEQQNQQNQIFEQNSQMALKIPEFEDLLPPNQTEQEQDVGALIDFLKEKFKLENVWTDHFDAINILRSWNKFKSMEFRTLMAESLQNEILNASENLRSSVQRTCLKLVREMFQVNRTLDLNQECVSKMTVKIFEKANFDKNFIRQEAINAIKCLEGNKTAICPAVLSSLCTLNFDKNFQICEMACSSLSKILMRKSANELLNTEMVPKEIVLEIFKTIAKNLEGKRAKMKKSSIELCQFLKKQLGSEAFETCVEGLQEGEIKIIQLNSMEKKMGDSSAKARNFKDFKKNRNLLFNSQNLESEHKSNLQLEHSHSNGDVLSEDFDNNNGFCSQNQQTSVDTCNVLQEQSQQQSGSMFKKHQQQQQQQGLCSSQSVENGENIYYMNNNSGNNCKVNSNNYNDFKQQKLQEAQDNEIDII